MHLSHQTYQELYKQVFFLISWTHKRKIKFDANDFLGAGARSLLVRNKFLRHGGARDLFRYMEEHVTCIKYIIG